MDTLKKRHPRFHPCAYLFLLDALEMVLAELAERRHVSGPELAEGVRTLAIARFGPMARTVLAYWGICSTEDLGEVVFALVNAGVLVKRKEDRLEDFEKLFDFEEVFERNYPWTVAL